MPGRHDPAARVRATRAGRRTGCYIYIPGECLERLGIEAKAGIPAPWYRITGLSPTRRKSPSVIVTFYEEA